MRGVAPLTWKIPRKYWETEEYGLKLELGFSTGRLLSLIETVVDGLRFPSIRGRYRYWSKSVGLGTFISS